MSKKQVLNVKSREGKGNGSARRCRREGMIPAVIYGRGLEGGRSITVCAREFRPLAHKAIHLIDLVDESGATTLALLKDIQFDYLKDCTVHLDFQAVSLDEKISAKLPVRTTGTPAGLAQGGLFEQVLHEIEISCTAGTLPDELTVNVDGLGLGQAMHVSELPLPEGVEALTDGSLIVFTVKAPGAEEEAPAAEAAPAPAAAPAKKK